MIRIPQSVVSRIAAPSEPNEVLHYGWPLVVVPDTQGRLHAAPLFATEVTAPDEDGQAVPEDDEPYLNPALLSGEYFAQDALALAQEAVAEGIGFGDAAAVSAAARRVAAALGLDAPALDPDRLAVPGTLTAGVHNAAVLVRSPSTLATRALIEELEKLRSRQDWAGTAAAWLVRSVDDPPPARADAVNGGGMPPVALTGLLLNDSQEQAATAALSRPLTVVTGPPGTGKSQLVASVVANQWLAGRSVLVASTNNGAVDVAVARCARIDEALLLRTGNRQFRDRLPETLEALAARGAASAPSARVIRRRLETAATGRAAVLDRFEHRAHLEATLAQLVLDLEQLRAILWGRPPGDATAPACDTPRPVADRFAEIRRLAEKALRRRLLRERRRRRLLALAAPTTAGATADDVLAWVEKEVAAQRCRAELAALGPTDADADRAALAAAEAEWADAGTTAVRDVVQQRLHAARSTLQQIARLRTVKPDARTQAMGSAVATVPGWACTALSVRSNFPLTPGLFDLLVLDEASQCSIAHVLPLAYRARRVLVVGDPNQLTPVVTLDRHAQNRLAESVGWTPDEAHRQALSVGQDSAFTAFRARCPEAPYLLDEHYRCHPAIARYFNEEFYAGALRILTPVDPTTPGPHGLVLVDVRGTTKPGPRAGACNEAEADAVVRWIAEHRHETGSIGVVTPFAAQRDLILERLARGIGQEAAAAVRVGTAHTFQGDECDVVLFSTVLTDGAATGTARWLEEQRNLVNVAVSRARRALVVLADLDGLRRVPVPTLHALVDLAAGRVNSTARSRDADAALTDVRALHSEAERRLFAALARAGVTARLKQVVEGYELDLVLEGPEGPVDVEVDGGEHRDGRGRQRRQDLARDAILGRLGWRVVRVPAWRALSEPDAVARELAFIAPR
jgi:very-short-patch-repair endonuclease